MFSTDRKNCRTQLVRLQLHCSRRLVSVFSFGNVGKPRIRGDGTLPPYSSTTRYQTLREIGFALRFTSSILTSLYILIMAPGALTPRGVRCNIIDDALALQFGDGMSTTVTMDIISRSQTLHDSVTDTSVEGGWVLDAPGRFVRDWLECLNFLGVSPANQSSVETIQSDKLYSYLEVRPLCTRDIYMLR